jgi:hypothetical protein
MTRRIEVSGLGPASDQDAAYVLDHAGNVIAVVAAPVDDADCQTLQDAVVVQVLVEDFGEVILAGVAFASTWGGNAIGFT